MRLIKKNKQKKQADKWESGTRVRTTVVVLPLLVIFITILQIYTHLFQCVSFSPSEFLIPDCKCFPPISVLQDRAPLLKNSRTYNNQNLSYTTGSTTFWCFFQNLGPDWPIIEVLGPALFRRCCWASPKQNTLLV